ncbi:MAG: AAA family ATPase [Hyphomicrobiales bacterium]|nr:AAA family ATPase [Hyphomicrobiales bacterium]MCY4048657.1 AAA family ATPase [Hyphomicrobiales bacterium]MCY4053963.1 AAA family ATPase [Hyphomicrobiales bacterium]
MTAFVGRNEAGKTTLLKALHKFRSATEERYDAQTEFPRDRFSAEYENGADWPVCTVEFELSDSLRDDLKDKLRGNPVPNTATFTRYYDGHYDVEYDIEIADDSIGPVELITSLDVFARGARRIQSPGLEQEQTTDALRGKLVNWADEKKEAVLPIQDLRSEQGVEFLGRLRQEVNAHSNPLSASLVEELLERISSLLRRAQTEPLLRQIDETVESVLPVFIYFENYGILDSTVYLPRFIEDLKKMPNDPRVRTINSIFKHVRLQASEIAALGREEAQQAIVEGRQVTDEIIQSDQKRKALRNVKLNSASVDISSKFNDWFGQRQHKIRYQADGDHFRVWVSDNRHTDVDIELESRSKGFQWFFSFYLVFLVESDEGHKDAMLLLDEPGLHLHPTAQQELLEFFEELSANNPLAYTTHSPFLINSEKIHHVRPVTEGESGHSHVSSDTWPEDRETIFPLQAAAGYAMVRGLFRHKKNVLVEGISDYLYLHVLNMHCLALGRTGLSDDVHITPCGGARMVGHIASLFLGQGLRPVVLLDGDEEGRARADALMSELYAGHERAVLMLGDVLQTEGCGIEDIIGESALLPVAETVFGNKLQLNAEDLAEGALLDQIEDIATRYRADLFDGWKSEIARRLVVTWSVTKPENMPGEVIHRAEALFEELNARLETVGR